MRRNMGRRGNNGNGGAGAGPLMTGHLQDIDLELELLKRKREMIEQQQQLLVMEQQFKSSRHSFDQMRYDEPDSNRDFTHLYETGPKHRSQFGRKRQAENQWQYDSAPKRTSSKKKSPFNQQGSGNPGSGNFRNQRPKQGQGPKTAPKQPAPLMEIKVKPSIGQKIANQKAQPKAPRKDFAPSKVAKPKTPPAPNKLASHTVTERKSLVAAATAASSDGDMSRMLLPDRVPSQQVSGRLELALGAIMKNIRGLIESQPQHAATLRSIQLQRVMKQAVRERIRTVMLGKVVGSLIEILAIYREEFPEETDADVLNIALEASGLSAPDQTMKTKFIESGDPGEFFRANLSKLLDTTLNEMFSKLEDIYGNAPPIDPAASEQQIDLQKKPDENGKDDQNEYKAFLNTTLKVYEVKRILPRLVKKYVPYVVKLLNLDAMYQTTKAAITMKANEKAAQIFGTTGEEGQGDGQTTAPSLPSKESRYNLPYYVKIMGMPTLPKRRVMQGFLSQFNPKSIKKHRTIHNLLFIGFTEKSDFDVMVGADGTVIGRSTLSVRICSKGGPQESNGETSESTDVNQEAIKQENQETINQENQETINQENQETINQENQNEGQIVPTDLEGQITDLLSAIRSEEEDARKENGEETENNGGEEKSQDVNEQAENNSHQDKMEESEDNVKNDEDLNENSENTGNEENKDEILDENAASQEKNASNEEETQHLEAANESEAQDTEATDDIKTENSEVPKEAEKPESIKISDDSNKDENSQAGEIQIDTDKASETAVSTKTDEQSDDKVGDLKSSATGRSTPSRMSARLANVTPSTIRTRRASRLTSQN